MKLGKQFFFEHVENVGMRAHDTNLVLIGDYSFQCLFLSSTVSTLKHYVPACAKNVDRLRVVSSKVSKNLGQYRFFCSIDYSCARIVGIGDICVCTYKVEFQQQKCLSFRAFLSSFQHLFFCVSFATSSQSNNCRETRRMIEEKPKSSSLTNG